MSETALVPMDLDQTLQLGEVLVKSGFFDDAKQASQAVVKVLAGRELGLGPIASMTGIHIVKGKPSIGANLIAAKVKASGRYNYRVIEHTEESCEIAFYEGKTEVGRSRFTLDDAKQAGITGTNQNWNKYPKNMLFARAISNGARWYCPDAFSGVTVYTPEELGAEVDGETGEVIDVTPMVVTKPEPAPEQKQPAKSGNGHQYERKEDRAKAMFNAVNNRTNGYYNAVPHMLNAIKVEAGTDDWIWPELDDEKAWEQAYNLALAHSRKNK